mmetsp:Transcript_29010/g.84283  ORF Transcript_29010/g.84283 Transcript_29010/m.84283 type:complete len:861 (+) Transcript_29010:392-2974(+)
MVSQHGPSTNKAAAILRASLNRRTDAATGVPILSTSRHGASSSSASSSAAAARRESGRPPVGFPPLPPSSSADFEQQQQQHRRHPTHDTVDVAAEEDDELHHNHNHRQESLALTDSMHGPGGIVVASSSSRHSSRPSSRNSVHDGHGDIEAALPGLGLSSSEHRARRTSATAKALGSVGRKLSAASLVRQVSGVGSLKDVDLSTTTTNLAPASSTSSPTSAAHHFPPSGGAGKDLDKPYDHHSQQHYHNDQQHHQQHNSCLIRFLHTRWMQVAAAVAVVCIVGAAVGATVGGGAGDDGDGGKGAATLGAHGGNPFGNDGSSNNNNNDNNGGSQQDEWEKWEAEQNYDDGDKYEEEPLVVNEDMEPVSQPQQGGQAEAEEVEEEAGTTTYESPAGAGPQDTTATTTTTETLLPPGAGGSTTGTGTPIWLSGQHFADPALTTIGSAVSFSADGTHLAISAAHSSTVQVYQLNLSDAGRNWLPLGTPLPGKVAALSGDGRKMAVADPAESTVTTYVYSSSSSSDGTNGGGWSIYGTRIVDIWGARSVSLSADGTVLAVAHYPDSICRICPSVASIFDLRNYGAQGQWVQEYDVLGAYDFDFSIDLSADASTLAFSGRVYENAMGSGRWQVKNAFPDFISSHSALSRNGRTAAISLPDCHIFKNTDPTLTDCTNTEAREVSVMEYRDSSTGGWWNRKGVSIGPTTDGLAGTTAIALSEDGNTVAVAVGGAGSGGEAALGGGGEDGAVGGFSGGAEGTSSVPAANNMDPLGPPVRRRRLQDQERLDDSNEDFLGYDAYDVAEAYVRVYRYDEASGDWYVVGEDIGLDSSGATLALSADGHRLAVGSPYGGSDERGYVKVYDMVMQ